MVSPREVGGGRTGRAFPPRAASEATPSLLVGSGVDEPRCFRFFPERGHSESPETLALEDFCFVSQENTWVSFSLLTRRQVERARVSAPALSLPSTGLGAQPPIFCRAVGTLLLSGGAVKLQGGRVQRHCSDYMDGSLRCVAWNTLLYLLVFGVPCLECGGDDSACLPGRL